MKLTLQDGGTLCCEHECVYVFEATDTQKFETVYCLTWPVRVFLFFGCLTSQHQASVSQGRISDNFTCCHTEVEAENQTFYLTQSRYTDTGLTSPSTDPITPGTWQGSHWRVNFELLVWFNPGKIPPQAGFEPGIFRSRGESLNHQPNESVDLWGTCGISKQETVSCPCSW